MDGTLTREQAAGMLVGEVMIANPKTLPASALVGDVRGVFEKKNVRTVLLAEGDVFRGAIERDGLPTTAGDDERALRFAEAEPLTTTPDTPMRDVLALLDGREEPRLVVLDHDGSTLRGLLCADSAGTGFCRRSTSA
ncbi:MAG: CBS domain-containing protein [Gaiellaceae bacterium]